MGDLCQLLNIATYFSTGTVYGEPEKAKKDLLSFADINEPRLYKLYKTCVDITSSLSAIVKARVNVSLRAEDTQLTLRPE